MPLYEYLIHKSCYYYSVPLLHIFLSIPTIYIKVPDQYNSKPSSSRVSLPLSLMTESIKDSTYFLALLIKCKQKSYENSNLDAQDLLSATI